MKATHVVRFMLVGMGGIVFVVALFLAGPVSLAADTAAVTDAPNNCVLLPVVLGQTGNGAPPGEVEQLNCLGLLGDFVDFNGDGFGDLAIGIPGEDGSNLFLRSGAVNVLYGTGSGLSAVGSQMLTQDLLLSQSQAGDEFGTAVEPADFNGDGYTDLAIGSPGEAHNGQEGVGRVDVVFGSPGGLSIKFAQVLSPANPAINLAPEEGDAFGQVLAAGDFNNDGFKDLAVGIPNEDYEPTNIIDMGAVAVFYGSGNGLRANNELVIHPKLPAVMGTAVAGGHFGIALAAADFDNDNKDDLAVGIPGYDINMGNEVGAVEVFPGSNNGVSLAGETLWRQGLNGIQGNPEDLDWFGRTLAAGDFDKNGASDLAVGVPYENVEKGGDEFLNAGAVHIIYGYAVSDGLSGSGDQIWHQGLAGVQGDPGENDRLGYSLAAADFNGDGADDLAVGIPGELVAVDAQGQVITFYSNGSILSLANQTVLMQGQLQGVPELFDQFGFSLGVSDFDGNLIADLAIGSPYENVEAGGEKPDAGAVNIAYGQDTGLGIEGNQIWGQHVNGIAGDPQSGDNYGWALSQ